MSDLIARLQEVANLKPGDRMPDWLCEDKFNWALGMSCLLQEAIQEIEYLRKNQRSYSEDMGR